MSPKEALSEAKAGKFRPVYLVAGTESFLRDTVCRTLREHVLAGAIADFNEDKFTAGEVPVERVIAACNTLPMMAARRFVFVRGADRWESSEGDESPMDLLAAYAQNPCPSTTLVVTAEKLDGRRKLATLGKKQGYLVACDPLSDRELGGWIASLAKEKGHTISAENALFLGEIAGTSLATLADTVERLSLYVGPGASIDEAAIRTCVVRVRLEDTWALVAHVGERNFGKAMAALYDAFDPRDRGLPLVGALAWSIRQLAKVESLVQSGVRPEDAAKRSGVPPFRVRDVLSKLEGLPRGEPTRWLGLLKETDQALKGSRRPPLEILSSMIARMCGDVAF